LRPRKGTGLLPVARPRVTPVDGRGPKLLSMSLRVQVPLVYSQGYAESSLRAAETPHLAPVDLAVLTTADPQGLITSDHPCVWFDPKG
jgi:hypothetical protein